MAWNFVEYKERLVQLPDSVLIITGYMLFYEGFVTAETAEEKTRFRQMALDFGETTVGGCTDLRLDQLLGGNTDKEDEFLHLLKLVKQRFASFGERIPAEHMGEFMPIPNYLRGCLVSPWFWTLLDALEALITGKPVLPVDPKERRLWRPQRKQGYDIPDVAQPRRLPPAKFVLSDFLSQIDRFVRQETKAPFSLFVNVRNLSQTDRDAVVAFVNAMDEPLRAMVTIELQ